MKVLICIGGPTASGKTRFAVRLASELGCEIVSFDSRQVYAELKIGVARPADHELSLVPHHMIGHVSIRQHYNAGDYEREGMEVLDRLFEKYDHVIATGGTGLYINALVHGLDDMPAVDPIASSYVENAYKAGGMGWLQDYVTRHDPEYASSADMNNPVRLLRAAKVYRSSGMKFSSFRRGQAKNRRFRVVYFYLNPARELLYERINQRVDQMVNDGLLNEAKLLSGYRHLKALQTVGYAELMPYFDGKITLEAALEQIRQNTRRYAKRQYTWFRNQGDWQSLDPDEDEENILLIKERLNDLEDRAGP